MVQLVADSSRRDHGMVCPWGLVCLSERLESLTLVGVLGCSQAPARDAVQDSTATDSLVGRFAGLLPCADCAEVRTDLRVFVERGSGRPTRYDASETYAATRDGDRTFEREGTWTIMRGSADNPDAVTYQLDHDQPQALRNSPERGLCRVRGRDVHRPAPGVKGGVPWDGIVCVSRHASRPAGAALRVPEAVGDDGAAREVAHVHHHRALRRRGAEHGG
jgi:NlpE-like protein